MKNRKNIRLPNYDYSQAGYYFVTICTKDREYYFCNIKDGKIILNDAGNILEKCINEISEHFPNSHVDYYCIMPNHIHMIIVIDDISVGNRHACSLQTTTDACSEPKTLNVKTDNNELQNVGNTHVGNTHACSLHRDKQLLPVIVGSLKSAVSKLVHCMEGYNAFKWQKSYHDHIIRNEKELYKIRNYIELNPMNWESDENNITNIQAEL